MVQYEREDKYTKPRDVKELLTLAREKEKASFGFYQSMSKHFFQNLGIRDLLNELRQAEVKHIQIIEKKLEELNNPKVMKIVEKYHNFAEFLLVFRGKWKFHHYIPP